MGQSQDVPSKYNKSATPKSSKDLEAQFTGAIKSGSINGTSGPSSLNEAIIEQNQVSSLVMDPLSIVLIYHKRPNSCYLYWYKHDTYSKLK